MSQRTQAKFQQDACNVSAMLNSLLTPTLLQLITTVERFRSAETTRPKLPKWPSGVTRCPTLSSVSTTFWEKLPSLWSLGLDTEPKLKNSRKQPCLPSTWCSWTRQFFCCWLTQTWRPNQSHLDLQAQCLISTPTGSDLQETPFVQLWCSTASIQSLSLLCSSPWDWPSDLWTAAVSTSMRPKLSQSKHTSMFIVDPNTWCTSNTHPSWTSSSSPSCTALVFQICTQLLQPLSSLSTSLSNPSCTTHTNNPQCMMKDFPKVSWAS